MIYGEPNLPGNPVCRHVRPLVTDSCHLHTLAWARDVYGVHVLRAPAAEVARAGKVLRLIELAEREGPVAIEAWVVDGAGGKLAGAQAVFCFPTVIGGTGEPDCGANLVPVTVKSEGHADFTMTGDGYIGCGELGPYAAWIDEPGTPSDRVLGLGMLAGTNHRHLNLLFQRVTAGSVSTPAARCPLAEP